MTFRRKFGCFQVFFVLSLLISISFCNDAFASSENWVEVTTLTGVGGIGSTKTFTVEHVDWRILWEIEPGDGSERKSFLVYIFPATGIKGSEQWFESIQHFGVEETTGILNIYNHSGSFYMDVLASIDSYKMIIEQNIDSIPEFPSWTLLVTGLLGVTVLSIIYGRDFKQGRKK